jgi:hypothetical protein
MWEPRRLTTVWAFTACYRDSFTFKGHTLQCGEFRKSQSVRPGVEPHSIPIPVMCECRWTGPYARSREPLTPRAVTTRTARVQYPQFGAVRCWKGEATLPEVGKRCPQMSQPAGSRYIYRGPMDCHLIVVKQAAMLAGVGAPARATQAGRVKG